VEIVDYHSKDADMALVNGMRAIHPGEIRREVPDFRESYEVAEGLYRRSVPAYDEKVGRDLLVNALGHRGLA